MTRRRFFFGCLFIVAGVVLAADQAGQVDAGAVARDWWPAIIVLAGVGRVAVAPRTVATGLAFGLVGGVLLLWSHGIVDSAAVVWPVALIAGGLALLFRGRQTVTPVVPTTAGDVTAVLSERRARADAGPLSLRTVTAIFADVDVDLTAADLVDNGRLKIVAVLGDVDVDVPADWQVVIDGPEILASVRTDTAVPPPGAAVLRIELVAVLADVTIRHRQRSG
ncbi:MAG: DUF5668 domain-containing protein [Nitriliruptoraceae bacterium]